jgi:hypothetical protein
VIGFVVVLFFGELALAACVGWLWHRCRELTRLQHALSRIHQATALKVAQFRDRRYLAEEQLQRLDPQRW